jgi:hypothetical protein
MACNCPIEDIVKSWKNQVEDSFNMFDTMRQKVQFLTEPKATRVVA